LATMGNSNARTGFAWRISEFTDRYHVNPISVARCRNVLAAI
jgi:hypothetical protein